MSEISKYKCNDCGKVSWTSLTIGCKGCDSTNLSIFTEEEQNQVDEEKIKKENWGCLIAAITIILVLFFTGILSITTEGCTLPIDLVFGNACIFGSFGASLGATIAIAVVIGIITLVGSIISSFFKNP